MEDAIENIDIGGPSMLRSAAKNYRDVTVVCDPQDYGRVLDEIRAGGNTRSETRLMLSAKHLPIRRSTMLALRPT